MTASEPYDVIVLGGGTAGVVAAIQAGRAGARTLLVEKTGMLGGTMTQGGVNNPGLFFAGTRQVIAGIGWEVVTRCLAEAGEALPPAVMDPGKPFWQRHVTVDRFLLPLLLDEMVTAASVGVLLHTMVAEVAPTAGQYGWQVTLCTKTRLETRTCAVLIDCTGDATGVALTGLPLDIPEEAQPATLCCRITGYDLAQLDIPAINRAFQTEVEAGRLRYTDVSFADCAADKPEGPYCLHSDGPVTPRDWECLDGTLFVDDGGAPWMVFCHEWVQVEDGEMCAIPLTDDLRAAAGAPERLFRASEAIWSKPFEKDGRPNNRVTDGPFLHRMAGGRLLMLWSTLGHEGYAMGYAVSDSGHVLGPWRQSAAPIYSKDGGHGMLFQDFDGRLWLTLH